MKISYNWLSQYIHLEESPKEVAELLTSIGLEVEGIERFESLKGGLQGLVVGEVVEKWQHPNADRLSCTKVNIGSGELLPIVCGAPNVAEGQKVIVATVGTILYPSGGESFEIKKAKIRGEESEGMICAEDEIGLGSNHDGIMVLDPQTKVGTPAATIFDIETDHVFEIGLTPNRADAASHFGVARDLRAALIHRKGKKADLCRPSVDDLKPAKTHDAIPVLVENSEACPRYVGVTISNLRVQPSPQWLQNKLKAIGVRSINNVVDVTNYVNHAFGQPLHAFDASKIDGRKVIVKTLPSKSKFLSLDEVERELDANDLMICNASEGMCIAGVFGGAKSGVTESTTEVFLESAYFNPVWIRKTAKRHALHTDASFRFERGIDPNITLYAAKLAAKMITEIGGGEISSHFSDTHPEPFEGFSVTYDAAKANRFIGLDIPEKDTEQILNVLDIQVIDKKGSEWHLIVPPFKVDVAREADVVEEVLRIFGYDAVPFTSQIKSTIKDMKPSASSLAKQAVTNLLVGNGFLECMSNSMVDERFGMLSQEWPQNAVVKVNNPLSSEMGIMRPALIFSALQNASYNLNRQQHNLKHFEFGNIYRNAEKGFYEEERLGITVSGLQISNNWRITDTPADWYFLKGSLEQILLRLGINTGKIKAVETTNDWFEYGMDWLIGDKVIMSGGSVSSKFKKTFDIKQRDVFYLEMRWNDFIALRSDKINIGDLPKYPEVKRDLALLVGQATQYAELEHLAYQTEKKLLRNVSLFDVYEGKGLPAGKKSYALSFSLRDENKTLTDEEVEKCIQRLLERFKRETGAELRG
ncbi:MAG: phenylalanine--tRNA ligase subunit beta [Flavobacteriales bacterium]